MGKAQEIIITAKQHNGMLTTKVAAEKLYHRGSLHYLWRKGALVKVSRGIYVLPDSWEDEFVSIQSRYQKGVFALSTALYLWQLTDRTPSQFQLIFPAGYNLTGAKEAGLMCSVVRKEIADMGVKQVQTPAGNYVRAYEAERTLCEILQTAKKIDVGIITEAWKSYFSRGECNISLLSQYAKVFRVEQRVRAYLEVLV